MGETEGSPVRSSFDGSAWCHGYACQCPGPLFEGERVCCRQWAPTRPPECRLGTDRGTVHPNTPSTVPPTCTITAPAAPYTRIPRPACRPPAPSRHQRQVCRAANAPSSHDAAAKVCGSPPYVRPSLSRRIYIERREATVQSALHATPHPSPPQIPGLAPAPPPFHTVWA